MSCGHLNPPGSGFCSYCGLELPHRRCRCGSDSPLDALYCGRCGQALSSPESAAGGAAALAPAGGKYDLQLFAVGKVEVSAPRPSAKTDVKLTQTAIRDLLKKQGAAKK